MRQRLVALPRPGTATCTGGRGTSSSPTRTGRRTGAVTHRDADGNEVVAVELPVVASAVEFTLAALVERVGPAADVLLPAAALARPAAAGADPADQPVAGAVGPGRVAAGGAPMPTRRWPRRCAGGCGRSSPSTFDATTVATTAAEAYALRRGVCQDIAHVMLTVCRLAGIPARYVSGHLLGEQGGSHAWVEVLVPDGPGARALAFDPTNGCRAGGRHLPVAVGRDYADVAPTSGVYTGTARGHLTWTKRAGITAA